MQNKPTALLLLLTLLAVGCNRPAAQNPTPAPQKPSFGEALESSFSQSTGEEKTRRAARQRQQELQARQQQLQEDRLKSYSGGTDSLPQNP